METESDVFDQQTPASRWRTFIRNQENKIAHFQEAHRRAIRRSIAIVLLILYCIYFIFALRHSVDENLELIVLSVVIGLICLHYLLRCCNFYEYLKTNITKVTTKIQIPHLKRVAVVLMLLCNGAIVAWAASSDVRRLISAAGIAVFIVVIFISSKHPSKIKWHPLLVGLTIQFLFGLVVLRWYYGLLAFDWLGEKATLFLSMTNPATAFIFGESLDGTGSAQYAHDFVFVVLPAVVFFGACTELAYFYGWLQVCISNLGRLMRFLMGVNPAEAFVAAANVFLGPNTAALTIATLLPAMTLAELHCVMTSGFACVDASLFGMYASFGVPTSYLIAASVMSAPAALAVAKLFYPETQASQLNQEKIKFEPPASKYALEAFAMGAEQGLMVVVHIVANLIAFVAALQFLNSTLSWFGDRAGVEEMTFEWVLSYVFYPIPLVMGVPTEDCWEVSRVLGMKIILTDIVGYQALGELINNRMNSTTPALSSVRSEVITAFALCGFGTLPDMAINLGALAALVPSKRQEISKVIFRAMIAGNLACFITACIAGILYDG